MSIIGNILWFILGGFAIFLWYIFGGLLLCLTIVGIPFGIQVWKLAGLALFPFGREITVSQGNSGIFAVIMNILWILFAGLEIACVHLVLAVVFGITIIGLPFAKQHIKLVSMALVPFGREIR